MKKPKQVDIDELIAAKQKAKGHNCDGAEVCDPTPIAAKVGRLPVKSQDERLREFFRAQRLQMEADAQIETAEDANDFAIENDYDPMSPHEEKFHLDQQALLEAAQMIAAERAKKRAGGAAASGPPAAPKSPPAADPEKETEE